MAHNDAMRHSSAVTLLVLALPGLACADDKLGLRVPPGFEVTEFADSKLANDIYRMTLDPRGRVVVSGRGYIRILVDDDDDGKADRAIEFADGPEGRRHGPALGGRRALRHRRRRPAPLSR